MAFVVERSQIMGLGELKRAYVRWVLEQTGGNKAEAARLLKMDRSSFYRVLRTRGCVTSHTEEVKNDKQH